MFSQPKIIAPSWPKIVRPVADDKVITTRGLSIGLLLAHAHEGPVITVASLFVCLFVCYQSTACVRHLCNKINIPVDFVPNLKGFQLRDFAKKLCLTSYSLFFILSIAKSAIFQFPIL